MTTLQETLEKALEKGRKAPAGQLRGQVWTGPKRPSYSVAACGWRGRTRYAAAHRRETGHHGERIAAA